MAPGYLAPDQKLPKSNTSCSGTSTRRRASCYRTGHRMGSAAALVEQATDFQKYLKVVDECTWVGTLLREDPDWSDGFRATREIQGSIHVDKPPKRQLIPRRAFDHLHFRAIFAKTDFTARTRAVRGNDVLAIIETKAKHYICMQEAAEMARKLRWSNEKEELCLLDLNGHRIIFLTRSSPSVADLGPIYHQLSRVSGKRAIGPNSFLYMKTYGPWNVLVRERILKLAIIVVSIILKTVPQE
ncbi:hypothetical protein P175DRAFT_0532882 [Aspergillus ochraceoroseus IBT 24754]|uniref:Uncharacterized protein n=1 Tax=Aspergillus ochraceoroseus IBT 24754 TaxID=1392256 RepID=A0A2T5LUF9_9EURO|nr:uncharacterized protein P175DRAFT_0532882 [Aspergillus ochraceoroseus IBT 24754]PTU19925.1 hypothetical protein P175DRAFT_0532882 [Aspergillus ochraceoroseus IBT 24754]